MQTVGLFLNVHTHIHTSRHQRSFGANQALFNSYFRSQPGGPPLCLTCGLAIGNHIASAAVGVPVASAGGSLFDQMRASITGAADGTAVDLPPPEALKVGADGVDHAEVPYMMTLLVVAGILGGIGLLLLIIFVAVGLVAIVPWVLINPIILIVIAFCLVLTLKKANVSFDRNRNRVRSETTTLGLCCCPTVVEGSFEDLGGFRE